MKSVDIYKRRKIGKFLIPESGDNIGVKKSSYAMKNDELSMKEIRNDQDDTSKESNMTQAMNQVEKIKTLSLIQDNT